MSGGFEAVNDLLNALGIKLGIAIAGFAGGIVSLTFLKGLSRKDALLAVFTSLAAATYLTPVVVSKIGITDLNGQYGTAFVVGICAMNIIPAIRAMVDKFSRQELKGADHPIQGEGGKQ